jgi:head-tail adaptor
MSVFESLLNNTFAVERRRRSPDGQGGWAIDYVAIGSVVGRMRPAGSREQDIADLESREITHVLYVVASANIVRGDRVSVGDLTVEVEGIREPSLAGHHLEIDCREVQPEQAVGVGS